MRHYIGLKFTFEAAHRLISAYSQECVNTIHGHSYKLKIKLSAISLNENAMVADFKAVKETVRKYIIDRYDHALILCTQDPLTEYDLIMDMPKLVLFLSNPTAEVMAQTIYEGLCQAFDNTIIRVESVKLWETENNYAEYKGR